MKKFKLKKVSRVKILVFTLMLFGATILASYPKSYPKYVDSGSLVYKVNFYSLFKGDSYITEIIKEDSTDTLAHYRFTFNRNDVVKDNTLDKYIITLPATCYYAPNGIKASDGGKVLDNTVSYTSTAKGANNMVEFYCNITFNENDIMSRVTVLLEEKVKTEDTFLYKRFISPEMTKAQYYELIEYVPDSERPIEDFMKLIVPDTETVEKTNELYENWINKFAYKYSADIAPLEEKTIINYVNNYCDKTNVTNCNVAGITYEHVDGNHVFTIDNSFVGYARTYNEKVLFDARILYFTSKDEVLMNKALTYYLSNYYEVDNKDEILAYITRNGGISALLNNTIPGIMIVEDTDTFISLKLSNNILGYLLPVDPEKPFKIPFNLETLMEKDFFDSGNINRYYGDIVSSSAEDLIKNGPDWEMYYNSATKNNTSEEAKSFKDYFVLYDPENKYYLLINIYSDVDENPDNKYNVITFTPLRVPDENFIITFNNTDTTLDITITYSNKDTVKEVIDYLDVYFNTSTSIDLSTLVPDENNNITVNYSVDKNINV